MKLKFAASFCARLSITSSHYLDKISVFVDILHDDLPVIYRTNFSLVQQVNLSFPAPDFTLSYIPLFDHHVYSFLHMSNIIYSVACHKYLDMQVQAHLWRVGFIGVPPTPFISVVYLIIRDILVKLNVK